MCYISATVAMLSVSFTRDLPSHNPDKILSVDPALAIMAVSKLGGSGGPLFCQVIRFHTNFGC